MIISALNANKMHLSSTALFTGFLNGPFNYVVLHCIVCYDVNLTISPLDRTIIAEFTNGVFHEDVTYKHPLFVNNSNNNHYFTNYSTNNRSVSTNGKLNSKTNHLLNISINGVDLPNSETAPLRSTYLN